MNKYLCPANVAMGKTQTTIRIVLSASKTDIKGNIRCLKERKELDSPLTCSLNSV